jgi:hypothetical protein
MAYTWFRWPYTAVAYYCGIKLRLTVMAGSPTVKGFKSTVPYNKG